MKTLTAILMIFFLLTPCWAKSRNRTLTTPANYVYALQTADSFLWAWVHRDEDAGRRLISLRLASELKREGREEWFRDYMVGVSNPHHHSFEIGSGKTMNPKRLSFPVVLYEHYTGESKAFKYKSRLEVVEDEGTWRIEVLPMVSSGE